MGYLYLAFWGILRSYNRPVLYIKKASNIYTTREFIKSAPTPLLSFTFLASCFSLAGWGLDCSAGVVCWCCLRYAWSTVNWQSWKQSLKVDLVSFTVQNINAGEQLSTKSSSLQLSKTDQSSFITVAHFTAAGFFDTCFDSAAVSCRNLAKRRKCYKKSMFIGLMQIIFKCPTQLDDNCTQCAV